MCGGEEYLPVSPGGGRGGGGGVRRISLNGDITMPPVVRGAGGVAAGWRDLLPWRVCRPA